jgi:hypothetical protein
VCRYWVDYWRGLTKERLAYRPYQEAAPDYPAIAPEEFARAVQFIDTDGSVWSGAAATFRTLALAPEHALWWWFYRHAPFFAAASERAYNFLSRRRGLLLRLSTGLWGPALAPERYELVGWTFLRLFGAVYMAAFISLGVQARGLFGSDGILPITDYLASAHAALGFSAYWAVPTLFWLGNSDLLLVAGTVLGAVLGVLVALDIKTQPCLIALFVLYLSYFHAGQDFMGFQWDLLLLEAGFLAMFLPSGSKIVVWLFRWLVFRYIFMAGAAKWVSQDVTWRSFSALQYHFWTQPLPTPLAWYAAQFPPWLLALGTAAALATELLVVFLIFLPRRLRALAAWSIILFQSLIVLTGNYNFFNLLTILLCIFLFDDAALASVVRDSKLFLRARARVASRWATGTASLLALVVLPLGLNRLWESVAATDLPVLGVVSSGLQPFMIVNPYGLFAVMTTRRPEIVIEGSADGENWREYVLPYKPGPPTRAPSWNIPHQPRLDWQLWFAALEGVRQNPWFENLMLRLLEGSPSVAGLFSSNPFPQAPPRYVRAELFEYRFADPSTHAATGQWWTRQAEGLYFPSVSLDDFARPNDSENPEPHPAP